MSELNFFDLIDFVNDALSIDTEDALEDALDAVEAYERRCGRALTGKQGGLRERVMDALGQFHARS